MTCLQCVQISVTQRVRGRKSLKKLIIIAELFWLLKTSKNDKNPDRKLQQKILNCTWNIPKTETLNKN